MDFLYGNEIVQKKPSSELERIKNFIDEFDVSLVDEFIDLVNDYDKIILFGYGPSFICTQYFEYKLRLVTNKFVIAVPDEVSVERLIDDNSLLIILSTTGKFRSFENLNNYTKNYNCKVLLLVEEYNTSLLGHYDNIFFLTKSSQSNDFEPHEKSRTVFFIFIEEVIQHIILKNRQGSESQNESSSECENGNQ
jgi:DNA-binding MurR/RpiR family transcriptional regulator